MNVVLKRSLSSKPVVKLITRSPDGKKEIWVCRDKDTAGFGLSPEKAFTDYELWKGLNSRFKNST
jgi:hypothetical protein